MTPSSPTPRVYSYYRFSSVAQRNGTSIERQTALASKWAADHGMVLDVALTLRDDALSAYHESHVRQGALGLFLAAAEQGRIAPGSVLVVEGLDRLSRAEPLTAQAQLTQIIKAGIGVVTAIDGKMYSRESVKKNPFDLLYALSIMIRANEESETKSIRVKAAMRIKCEKWIEGTWRGRLGGKVEPPWVRWVKERNHFELIPERVATIKAALQMYRDGKGSVRIVRQLKELGLSYTETFTSEVQITRLRSQRALLGEKEITIDGKTYLLNGYYPTVLTRQEWDELQGLSQDRGRRHRKGDVPGILTGMNITVCGYCSSSMASQTRNDARARNPDGRIRECYRRLRCVGSHLGRACPIAGSCQMGAVERAVMRYCSDLVNLQALVGKDLTAEPRAQLIQAQTALADVDQKLKRLADLFLAGAGNTPATFLDMAHQLEAQRAQHKKSIAELEAKVAASARMDVQAAHAQWKALRDGVEQQRPDDLMKARQLVADTFVRVAVYYRGMRPRTTVKGVMDIVLLSKSGITRTLRIDENGELLHGLDVDVSKPLPSFGELRAKARRRGTASV
jgi:DNA invertase Pin-like site-specific DNA recombinase